MIIKKVPQRKCTACGLSKDKKELIRIVRISDDAFEIDPTGKKNGRGAYICNNRECFEILTKKKILDKSFKQKINSQVYESLKEQLEELYDDKR